MPQRSNACKTCRQRKIRCDEARPTCRKCEIHGVICPGYKTLQPGGFEFIDQTSLITKRVEGRKNPESGTGTPRVDASASSSVSEASTPSDLEVLRGHDELCFPMLPQQVRSAVLNREQIFNISMQFYMPQDEHDARIQHFTALSSIRPHDTEHPALLAAVDTLSLVQMAVSFKDPHLHLEARRHYGIALTTLMRALTRRNAHLTSETLAAITLLEYCELFGPISQYGSWVSHVHGLEKFIVQRGPAPLTTQMELMLFHQARHSMVALIHGVLEHKAIVFAKSEWLKVSREGLVVDDTTLLFDIAVVIPGLLERTDNLLSDPMKTNSFDLVADIAATLEDLHEWLSQWYARMDKPAYDLVDVSDFTAFTNYCDDKTFPLAYQFPTFMVAYLHSIYWQYLCVAQKALMEILQACPDNISIYSTNRLRNDVLQNMLNLCQTIPYFCESHAASVGRFATFVPLFVAMQYFAARQMQAQLQWCNTVCSTIYSDGMSPPWLHIWKTTLGRIQTAT